MEVHLLVDLLVLIWCPVHVWIIDQTWVMVEADFCKLPAQALLN